MATARLQCDHCGTVRQSKSTQTLDELREALVGIGWLCRKVSGTEVDVCPTCRDN